MKTLRFLACAAALAASLLATLECGGRRRPAEPRDLRTGVILRASEESGAAPLAVVLTAELHGMSLKDRRFCGARLVWTRKCGGEESVETETLSACLKEPNKRGAPARVFHSETLDAPGACTFRVRVYPRGSDLAMVSDEVTVTALAPVGN